MNSFRSEQYGRYHHNTVVTMSESEELMENNELVSSLVELGTIPISQLAICVSPIGASIRGIQ